jgi:transposase
MYRIRLTEQQQQELHKRAHQHGIAPRTRERLEIVRLSDKGWSIPKIALHMDLHEQTVRLWVKAFLKGDFDALQDKPHVGQKSAITPEIMAEVIGWIEKGERTWNAPQIAAEVHARYGILRSAKQWRTLLHRHKQTYKRTRRSLRHKQDPEKVQAKSDELDALKRGPTAGNTTSAISTKPDLP